MESAIKKNAESDDRELEKIEEFKKGYLPIIEKQLSMARAAQQLLASGMATQQERAKMTSAMAEIDKALIDIQNVCRQTLIDITPTTLEKEAGRDYHSVFTEEINDHRLSYISFLKSYIHLKRFALETSEMWRRIQTKFMGTGLPQESDIYRQFLSYRVAPGIQICEMVQTFCIRMEKILSIKKDPLKTKTLNGIAVYSPEIPYQLSTVFMKDLSSLHATPAMESSEDTSEFDVAEERKEKKARKTPDGGHMLNSAGDQPWNDTPDYYFSYDPRILEQERQNYQDVIYVDTHMGADQQFLRGEVIRKFSGMGDKPTVEEIEKSYEAFLNSYFNLVADISALNMNIPGEKKKLFLFHLGPQAFYMLTRRFLQEAGTGTFHLRSGKSKIIKKYIPVELLKSIIIAWWRSNVLADPSPEINDYAQYRNIIRSVQNAYVKLSEKASQEFDKLPESVRNSKSRQDIFREHISEWMGGTNLILFRRFLQKKVG